MKKLLCTILSLLLTVAVYGQVTEIEWRDTLRASYKTDSRVIRKSHNIIQTDIKEIRGVVSPLGEGDPIRWAQTLPGIATGADGGTAIYVRGGNAGSNLFSLDGIPIYGFSHILGLTTIVPSGIIDNATLVKGGFDGSDGNFTASHLRLTTKNVTSDEIKTSFAVNNFLSSVGLEGRLGKKTSFILSGRLSPLTYEYRLVKGLLPSKLGSFKDFKAGVGDIYAKAMFDLNKNNRLSASLLYSNDVYSFNLNDESRQKMGWNNVVAMLKYRREGEILLMDITASFNNYNTFQDETKTDHIHSQRLMLASVMREALFSADFSTGQTKGLTLQWGTKYRYSEFASGNWGIGAPTKVMLATIYAQAGYIVSDKLELMAAAKGNYYRNLIDSYQKIDPELNLSAKINLSRKMSVEATFDRLAQYYHTLEGMPLGWSLDLIVPSLRTVKPEYATQGALGVSFKDGGHNLSASGFFKQMDNLVYYKYAQSLFSGALTNWQTSVDIGKGRSYGAEFLYEFSNKAFTSRLAYTWSRTNRYGFPGVNDGKPFHARFDREHILSATAQWKGFCANFIFQSGQWENAAAESYLIHTDDGIVVADYFQGVNNYQMPSIIRLDIGYQFGFRTGKVDHNINVGICNVLNHFNPFMLYFDYTEKTWQMLALLPILPNFSYRIEF